MAREWGCCVGRGGVCVFVYMEFGWWWFEYGGVLCPSCPPMSLLICLV